MQRTPTCSPILPPPAARRGWRRLALWRNLRQSLAWLAALLFVIVVGGPAEPSAATPADLPADCDAAAAQAARQTGVPISVLKAISLNETGRKRGGAFRPWPWTVNMEGKGVWFDTEEEARAYALQNHARGARSFDVGCFQINYKWHGENFASIEEMFQPLPNALYAAEFLKRLHAELGSWGKAAGAYHSRTPSFAEKYQARFERFRSALLAEDSAPLPAAADVPSPAPAAMPRVAAAQPRVNGFPLLQVRETASNRLGSLVPLAAGGQRRLIGERN
jgi:hypothetical protein